MGVEFTDHYYSEHPEDHELWIKLWQYATSIKPDGNNISAILAYLRNCGCQLIRVNNTYVIRAHTMPEQDYIRERQYLMPYKDIVLDLLARLGKEVKQ